MTMQFDTLEYSNSLEQAGIARPHAEAIARLQAKALSDLITHELVTKDFQRAELLQVRTDFRGEMQALRTELKGEMQELRTEVKGEINELRTEVKREINELRTELKGEIGKVRSEMNELRTELKAEFKSDMQGLRSEFKLDIAQLEVKLREEIRREGDAIRLQLRSLQYGGAIAAFAITLVVMLSRLIK